MILEHRRVLRAMLEGCNNREIIFIITIIITRMPAAPGAPQLPARAQAAAAVEAAAVAVNSVPEPEPEPELKGPPAPDPAAEPSTPARPPR
ncbi:hypothetical protein DL764_003509 [Monosporascus ibericus]|uniref:Uncharacterized protein n=1 Tax=Monosporascus ibericus TaxID=155417 RepID=A0A4Q4TG82_9PEZI|nr:hypothetical protein DL764_003509 [Monosporascus ibericus]